MGVSKYGTSVPLNCLGIQAEEGPATFTNGSQICDRDHLKSSIKRA